MKGRKYIKEILQKFKYLPNNILGMSCEKYFQDARSMIS